MMFEVILSIAEKQTTSEFKVRLNRLQGFFVLVVVPAIGRTAATLYLIRGRGVVFD